MRRGAAVSLIVQTGHSDDNHSPDEWASVVVRRINPASLSIAVVWTVAISWPPSALRTMSSPLDSASLMSRTSKEKLTVAASLRLLDKGARTRS